MSEREPTRPDPPDTAGPTDPVLIRRAKIAHWVDLGRRTGALSLAISVAAFSIALFWNLPQFLITITIGGLIIGAICLLPAIVFGYAVRAADREDRELGHGGSAPRH